MIDIVRLIFFKTALSIFFFGCYNTKTDEEIYREYKEKLEKKEWDSIQESKFHGFRVIVIDSCEYLIKSEEKGASYWSTHAGFMSHKGNCRFCEERKRIK